MGKCSSAPIISSIVCARVCATKTRKCQETPCWKSLSVTSRHILHLESIVQSFRSHRQSMGESGRIWLQPDDVVCEKLGMNIVSFSAQKYLEIHWFLLLHDRLRFSSLSLSLQSLEYTLCSSPQTSNSFDQQSFEEFHHSPRAYFESWHTSLTSPRNDLAIIFFLCLSIFWPFIRWFLFSLPFSQLAWRLFVFRVSCVLVFA